jgi:hypothetical protein
MAARGSRTRRARVGATGGERMRSAAHRCEPSLAEGWESLFRGHGKRLPIAPHPLGKAFGFARFFGVSGAARTLQ